MAKQLEELKSKGFQVARTPLMGKWLGIPGAIEEMDYMVCLNFQNCDVLGAVIVCG